MKKILIIFISILILFISCKKNKAEVIHRWQTETIGFYLNKEANLLTETAVKKAFQEWQNQTHFIFTYEGRNIAGLKKDGKNSVSFLIKWPKNIPLNKVAWCQNWYDKKGNIIESDIIFNMTITRFTTLESNTPNSYYIEGVLIHEIGHMLGLDHIQSEDSIMKQKSSADESFFKGKIDKTTIEAYKKLYSEDLRDSSS